MPTLRNSFIIAAISFGLFACRSEHSAAQATNEALLTSQDGAIVTELSEEEEAAMHLIGTIEYQDFEGGFYGFVAKDGKKYTLNKLAKEHRRNGLIVEITAEPMTGMATTTQFGELLNVHDIKIVDDSKVVNVKQSNEM